MSGEKLLGGRVVLHHGDSREVLRGMADGSIDSAVMDPPYALDSIKKRFGKPGAAPAQHGRDGLYARASAGFMGQVWDTGEAAFDPAFWAEVLRVLKPGGHLLAFGGTRTYHRLACAVEDAGFEIRDSIVDMVEEGEAGRLFLDSLSDEQARAFGRVLEETPFGGLLGWVYGVGFPKNHDVAKGIDRHLGANGEKIITGAAVKRMIPGAEQHRNGWEKTDGREFQPHDYIPATPEAAAHAGYGTSLKPAWEPIVVARKPLIGSVAENVLAHGTGALNIDGCRVEMAGEVVETGAGRGSAIYGGGKGLRPNAEGSTPFRSHELGRWPANVIHDGSPEVLAAFPDAPGQQGALTGNEPSSPFANIYGEMQSRAGFSVPRGDSGSAARFFYSAKADAADRAGSKHPTIKRVALMQWACRLVTPPGGVVLDAFAGSGSTGEAAWREGFRAVLIEREAEYCADIRRRMALAAAGPETRRGGIARARGKVADDAGPLFGGEGTA